MIMKNKGMHQQPNAFSPSTGHSAVPPKNAQKGSLQPTPSTHGVPAQQSWNKPKQGQQSAPPVKSFGKTGKKAA
jgi:hypothetical protein